MLSKVLMSLFMNEGRPPTHSGHVGCILVFEMEAAIAFEWTLLVSVSNGGR